MKHRALVICLCAVVAALALAGEAVAQPKHVTISGRAYAFNHMDTFIAGATIRVREDPKLTAVTDANGDYTLRVPVDMTVTPYIDPPAGYHEIDLQTFHTRYHDIENANFQTPADAEYYGLAALLGVALDANDRPQQCVIVTTASARDVRGVDYDTFRARTPHGVAGATSSSDPELPDPTYFNESVIPDPNQPSTSGDGGIVWTGVAAGAYRIGTDSPNTDFASFLASCEPGRVINANPPWGAYELGPGEKPLRAGTAVGGIDSVKAKKRKAIVRLGAAEKLTARIKLKVGDRAYSPRSLRLEPGGRKVKLRYGKRAAGKRASVVLKIADSASERVKSTEDVRLPG